MAEIIIIAVLAGGLTLAVILLIQNHVQKKRLEEVVIAQAKGLDELTDECAQSTVRLKDAREILPEKPRYQISVTDWGPDFTGEDGTLPRWRWVVQKADANMEAVLNGDYHLDEDKMVMRPMFESSVLMLGNTDSFDDAMFMALSWVEEHANPPVHMVWEPPSVQPPNILTIDGGGGTSVPGALSGGGAYQNPNPS